MKKDIVVLLLAGGKSERFWPLPHKMTIPFLGKTLLHYQIDLLKKVGFQKIVTVLSDETKEHFSDTDSEIVIQKGDGMAAGVLSAQEHIEGKPLLIHSGDDVISEELLHKIKSSISSKNFLVGKKVDRYIPGGYFKFVGDKIVEIQEKPGEGHEPSNYTKLVDDYFVDADSFLTSIENVAHVDPDIRYEAALTDMIKRDQPFEMVDYDGIFLPLKFPWQTLSIMEYFLSTIKENKISPKAWIGNYVTIEGPVVIEDGVRIFEYTKLTGPLYIGKNTIIGNNTIVRHSMIGENSVIGFGSDVTRSYIGNDVWFHTNYVGDSAIANHVAMGAGAVLANLRLDEGEIHSVVKGQRIGSQRNKFGAIIGEGARIGIEAKLMPGVKIGKNSVIGPGVLLTKDVPDNKRVFVKQELTVEENTTSNIHDRNQFRNKL